MPRPISRRGFFAKTGVLAGSAALSSALAPQSRAATTKRPQDFIIVEGHRDIWEQNDRFKLRDKAQHSPMRDFILPRLLEAGMSVCIMPTGGDSVAERGGRDHLFEGSMRVLDMLIMDIEKCGDKASILRTKQDVPTKPNRGKVQFFLDMEGGGSIQNTDPEPEYFPERKLALLRQFFRLGMRGMQLTHNARNMVGDGIDEGKPGNRLSSFGVEVVREMNRLGMMIGVSHLSSAGVLHACEISKHPVVSTHQNVHPLMTSNLEITVEEQKAIAKTGGIVGIRYIVGKTSYKFLVDEVEYLAKTIGPEHIGIGWLGHDKGHPAPGYVPGVSPPREFTGPEAQSIYEHWDTFLKMLSERGFSDDHINLILGANYSRIWRQILPDETPSCVPASTRTD